MAILPLLLTLANCGGDAGAVTSPAAGSPDTILASVSPAIDTMLVGDTVRLQARGPDEQPLNDPNLDWSSSLPDVASVGTSGLVIAQAPGITRVTARYDLGRPAEAVIVVLDQRLLPAFPGAEGWGAEALNECRALPLQVLKVSNADSDGPGSLAQAVSEIRSDRNSFVLFETGGVIQTPASSNGIKLNASCAYFAGQTARGAGLVIEPSGGYFWIRGTGGQVKDVVMRYIRFRGRHGSAQNHLIIAKGENIVLDHLSFSWSDNYLLALIRYGGMSWSGPIRNVSIQNSLMAEVFAVHPTAFVLGTNEELKPAASIEMTDISIQRNLMAHNSHRNPMIAADNALIANNVVYNWRHGAGMMNRRGMVDWISNYAKAGPMTDSANSYVVNAYCDELGGDFSIFAEGNIGPRSLDPAGSNWVDPTRQVACFRGTGDYDGQAVPAKWRRDVRQSWQSIPFPVQLIPAETAYQDVLDDVGSNALLTCDGRWVQAQDPVDVRIVQQTRSGTGRSEPPESEADVGGFPSYEAGVPCADADDDGLPDEWERRFFSCDDCADPAALGRHGYLLIEHYVNGTQP